MGHVVFCGLWVPLSTWVDSCPVQGRGKGTVASPTSKSIHGICICWENVYYMQKMAIQPNHVDLPLCIWWYFKTIYLFIYLVGLQPQVHVLKSKPAIQERRKEGNGRVQGGREEKERRDRRVSNTCEYLIPGIFNRFCILPVHLKICLCVLSQKSIKL